MYASVEHSEAEVAMMLMYWSNPPDYSAVDITVYHNGFHGDLNETFYVGEVDEGARKLVQTTYECLMQAIDSGKVLTPCDLRVGLAVPQHLRTCPLVSVQGMDSAAHSW
jgi:hypothetical protein